MFANKPQTMLWVSPQQLPQRILLSFIPKMRRAPTDLVGPALALATLMILLSYGHTNKILSAASTTSPVIAMLCYTTSMPLITYTLVYLAQGSITLLEAVVIIGYGLFGHVFTFLTTLSLNNEQSNTVFFCCLVVIGGLSALRLAVALLIMVPRPAPRLVVCSVVATLQMLSLIFLHFTYMHTTFRYAHRA